MDTTLVLAILLGLILISVQSMLMWMRLNDIHDLLGDHCDKADGAFVSVVWDGHPTVIQTGDVITGRNAETMSLHAEDIVEPEA